MKKIIILMIAFSVALSAFPNIVFANEIEAISLDEFSEQIEDMINEDEENINSRIIVKAEGRINQLDAVETVEGYKDYHILEFSDKESADAAVEYYSKRNNVKCVERDKIYTADFLYDDPPEGYLSYGSAEMGFDKLFSYVESTSYSFTGDVTVAVIDTGIEYDHEFLVGRCEDSGFNSSGSGDGDSAKDDNGHGTHVAGIIKDNTPENVMIRGYKVLNSEGKGDTVSVILGIEQALNDGVDLINMSLGGKKEDNSNEDVMHSVIKEAYEQEVPVVVAAGNEGDYAGKYSPGCYEECITVMACGTEVGTRASFSNFGNVCDISACGSYITSSYLNGTYRTLSGTSMATPYVAAAVSLCMLIYNIHNSDEIVELLLDYSVPCEFIIPDRVFNNQNVAGSSLYVEYLTRELQYLSEPIFSTEGGEFDRTFKITIQSADDAIIYYLINDNPHEFKYNQPIEIRYDTVIRAFCYKKGCKWSNIVEQQYKRTFTDEESEYDIDKNGIITNYYNDADIVSVPNSINGITVKGIGSKVFSNKSLSTVILPNTLTSIGSQAFANCNNLSELYSDSVNTLGQNVFANCKNLKNVYLPNVKEVKYGCFKNCPSLESYDFNGIESIGHRAFEGCNSIYSCSSDSITAIASYAFNNSGIKYIDLPNVQEIEQNCFDNCVDLETAYFINADYIAGSGFRLCKKLENTDFTNCKYIDKAAFSGCSSLKKVDFPNMICNLMVAGYQFNGCSSLESISFPKLEQIDAGMFSGCTLLNELYLPALETIDKNAFLGSSVEYVYSPNVKVCNDFPRGEKAYITVGKNFAAGSNSVNNHLVIQGIKGTEAEEYAKKSGIEFISVDAFGATIRLSDSGLRFGFSFFDSFGNKAEEYGFVYAYENTNELDAEKNKRQIAYNKLFNDGITTYNLVFTNIPKASYETEISVKAYVKINGRYFYSDIIVRSFKGVANAIINDESIDSYIKEKINTLLEA